MNVCLLSRSFHSGDSPKDAFNLIEASFFIDVILVANKSSARNHLIDVIFLITKVLEMRFSELDANGNC